MMKKKDIGKDTRRNLLWVLIVSILLVVTLKSALGISFSGCHQCEWNVTTSNYSVILKNATIKGLWSSIDNYTNDHVSYNVLGGAVMGSILQSSWRIGEGVGVTNCTIHDTNRFDCYTANAKNNFTFYDEYIKLESMATSGNFRVYHYWWGDYDGASSNDEFYVDYSTSIKTGGNGVWTDSNSAEGIIATTNNSRDFGLWLAWDESSKTDFDYLRSASGGVDYHAISIGRGDEISQNTWLEQYIRIYEANMSNSGDEQYYSISRCFEANPTDSCHEPAAAAQSQDNGLNLTDINVDFLNGAGVNFTKLTNNNFSFAYNHTEANPRWFRFNISQNALNRSIAFEIINYADGVLESTHKPYYSYDGEEWIVFPNVEYSNPKLIFSHNFTEDQVEIAAIMPFDQWRWEEMYSNLSGASGFQIHEIGNTVDGADVDLIKVTNFSITETDKQHVFIVGRLHAAEMNAQNIIAGMLNNLNINNDTYNDYKNKIVFNFVPFVNVDGWALGNHRNNANDNDLNREFDDETKDAEALALWEYINETHQNYTVDLLFDMHTTYTESNFLYALNSGAAGAGYYANQTVLHSYLINETHYTHSSESGLTAGVLADEMKDDYNIMAVTLESSDQNESNSYDDWADYGDGHLVAINNYLCVYLDCSVTPITENTDHLAFSSVFSTIKNNSINMSFTYNGNYSYTEWFKDGSLSANSSDTNHSYFNLVNNTQYNMTIWIWYNGSIYNWSQNLLTTLQNTTNNTASIDSQTNAGAGFDYESIPVQLPINAIVNFITSIKLWVWGILIIAFFALSDWWGAVFELRKQTKRLAKKK